MNDVDTLLAEVCPQVENVEDCLEELPEFWKSLAPIMWNFALSFENWCGELCAALVFQIFI